MQVRHYLSRVKCNHHKGVISSWDETLKFISDDQRYEKSIKYERIRRVHDLDGYEKLGNFLIYLATVLAALIVIVYESVGGSRLYVQSGFYISIIIALLGLYLFTRFGLLVEHKDFNDNMMTTKFSGSKSDIHRLSKIILSQLKKILNVRNEDLVIHFI